jgi:hypothetical protein
MDDYATGGLVTGPTRAPDALHLTREQVIDSRGVVRCVTYWESLWWPKDGSPHPVHGKLRRPRRGVT